MINKKVYFCPGCKDEILNLLIDEILLNDKDKDDVLIAMYTEDHPALENVSLTIEVKNSNVTCDEILSQGAISCIERIIKLEKSIKREFSKYKSTIVNY